MKAVPVVLALVMLCALTAVGIVTGSREGTFFGLIADIVGVSVVSGSACAAASLVAYRIGTFGFRLTVALGMWLLAGWLTTFFNGVPLRMWLFAYAVWSTFAFFGTWLVRQLSVPPSQSTRPRFTLGQMLLVMIAAAIVMGLSGMPQRVYMVHDAVRLSLPLLLNVVVASVATTRRRDGWILLALVTPSVCRWLPLNEIRLQGNIVLLFTYPHMAVVFVANSWWSSLASSSIESASDTRTARDEQDSGPSEPPEYP